MACQLRTFGAGVAVIALCFMLASLSWQFLLLGFAAASVLWALYSWSMQFSEPKKPREEAPKAVPFERRRRPRRQNVYDFPAQEWGNQSTGY